MNGGNAYQVNIKVSHQNDSFNFTYEPSVLHVHANDTVTWVSEDGSFAIEFKENTPGDALGVYGPQYGTVWRSAPLTIRADAPRGHYHYAVAVSLTGERFGQALDRRVLLDAACPEIIVN